MMRQNDSVVNLAAPRQSEDLPPDSSVDGFYVSADIASELSRIQFRRDLQSSLPLLAADCLAVVASAILGNFVALIAAGEVFFTAWTILALTAWIALVQHVHALYPACGLPHTLEFRRCLRTCLLVTAGLVAMHFARRESVASDWPATIAFVVAIFALLPTIRSWARTALSKFDWWTQPVIIVGEGEHSRELFRGINHSRSEGIRPLGVTFNCDQTWSTDGRSESIYVGPVHELGSILLATRTSRIAVADPQVADQIDFHKYCGIPHVSFATTLESHPTEKTTFRDRYGNVEFHCVVNLGNPSARFAKRLLDLGSIIFFSPLLLPIFLVLGLLVKLSSKGPVFYSQNRIGSNGKTFRAWKFRSMIQDADEVLSRYLTEHPELREEWERDHKLKNDPRVTRVGRFLRKTSLDELPQLWNVLLGDMSLVGPRPIVAAEVTKYRELFQLYKLVRPGITGLWQVSGRNNTSYAERLSYDRYYIQNWSCMLDVYILYRTIKTALLQEGAY